MNHHIVNQPGRIYISDGNGSCVTDEHYLYDGAGSYTTAPTAGMVTKHVKALTSCWSGDPTNDGNWTMTAWEYDAYGNQTKEIPYGAGSNIETTYDTVYHSFPTERRLSVNSAHKETVSYYGVNAALGLGDARAHWGQRAEFCAVNEICTRYGYDDYGRVNRRWDLVEPTAPWSGNTDAAATVQWTYTMHGTAGLTRNVISEWRAPRCYGNFQRKIYDGLGQLIQVQGPQQDWSTNMEGCNPGNQYGEVDISYQYDALGNQIRTGVPVATTANYSNRAANWGAGYTATTYDVLGRPKSATAPNGETTTYKYSGRSTRVVAEGYGAQNGTDRVLKWTETNALGQLYRIRTYDKPWEQGGSTQAEVLLTHDVLGNLTQVSYPNGGTATMTYDVGGRKVSMNDPHLGTWTYDYDRRSRLKRQTDARGKTTCLYYDNYSHLAGKHFRTDTSCPGSVATYDIRYTYDGGHSSSNRSRGQLTRVNYENSNQYDKHLYYNAKGQLAQEQLWITNMSGVHNSYYAYDAYDRLNWIKYPDNDQVTTTFNSMGLPATLHSSAYGLLIDSADYDASGRLTSYRAARTSSDDLYRTNLYGSWSSNNGRLAEIRVGSTPNSAGHLHLQYGYDSFGNISTLTESYDNSTPTAHSLSYDDQNRITQAFGESYSWQDNGQFNQFEGAGFTYNAWRLNAVNLVNGVDRYDYDENGNMTRRNKGLSSDQTLFWDHENHLQQVKRTADGVVLENYLYDDNGIRVKKSTGGIHIYYTFPFYEVHNGQRVKYYLFGGERVAMYNQATNNLLYLHNDHLGGTAATTYSSSGDLRTYQSYDAYGEQRDGGTLLTENQFTGQKLDDTGLYYFRARYYDPQIGHFISPDSIVPDATNVFDYNRFMFVRGNPLKYSDPTGHVYELGTGTGGKYRGIAPLLHGYQFANEVLAEAGTWIHNHPNYDPTNDPDLLPSQKTVLHVVYEQLHLEQGNDEVATYHHMRRLGMDNPDIAADMLDVGFSNFVGGGIGLSVSGIILFRAVGPAELLDLQNTGRFSNPAGIEGKYFSLTEEGARQYGNMAEAAFGDPSYSYVETSIPDSSLTSDMMVTVDRGVPAVVVPTDQLDQLAPPRVILD